MSTAERSRSVAWAKFAPRASIALVTLGAAGGSLGLLLGFLGLVDKVTFLTGNAGTLPERTWMLGAVALGAVLAALPFAVILLATRLTATPRVSRIANWVAPLCLLGFIPMLLTTGAWVRPEGNLNFLALLTVLILVAKPLFELHFRASPGECVRAPSQRWRRLRRTLPTFFVWCGALGYAVYFSYYTLLNHRCFGTSGFDLGINVNWCFNALHGSPFRTTVLFGPDGGSMLAGHAIYAVFLWVPLFALKPGPEVLLIYQATMVGLAALPLYWFARTQIPRGAAALVALSYLLYGPLHGPNFYDFHELLVVLPWHFTLYWLLATNRLRWATLIIAVIWAHREDLAVGTAVVGVFLVLTGARPRFGARLAVASVVWFLVDKFVIMASAGSWWFASIYKDLVPAGQSGYGPVVHTILINPAYFLSTLLSREKLIYFLHIFAPLAFLPLRRPVLAWLALPGFFFTLMTTGYSPTISTSFQYTTHWVPYVFASAVLALRVLGGNGGHAALRSGVATLVFAALVHSYAFGAVIRRGSFVGGFREVTFVETAHDKAQYAGFLRLTRKIPKDASVAASEYLLPHVAARLNAFTLKDHHGDADYLLVRRSEGYRSGILQQAFNRNDYGLVDQFEDMFFLFKKGYVSEQTRHATGLLGLQARHKP